MRNTFIIASRVIQQLKGDKRFLILSIIAPIIIIYFLKLFFDAFPPIIQIKNFIFPIVAFIVHFLSFLLCAILLVQERVRGTLERMLISGFRKTSIIGGYTLGYMGLASLQAAIVLLESMYLFSLDFNNQSFVYLFIVIWLLAVVSVMLGIFISTFARHEGHIIPFVPLIIIPSVFLSGLIIDTNGLPIWAAFIGKLFPLHYAVNIIREITNPDINLQHTLYDFGMLLFLILVFWILASLTLKETN